MVLHELNFWELALDALLVMLIFVGCVAIGLALDVRRNDRRLEAMRKEADDCRDQQLAEWDFVRQQKTKQTGGEIK